MYTFLRRTWAEINLDSLQYNTQLLLNSTKNKTSIMAVVKADAYGHGDKMIVNELSAAGINFFAVSNLDEALCIRKFNKKCNILVLGFTPITSAKTLMEFNIHQTVFSSEYAVSLNDFCREHSLKIKAHLKLDTGMSRIGFCSSTDDEYALIKSTLGLECLDFVGVFTHLSSADTNDEESILYTQMQMKTFNSCVLKLKNDGKTFKYIHMQNSAAIIKYDAPECNYSRAGIIMYGISPSEQMSDLGFLPVMSIKSVVSMVKTIKAGTAVSYGRNFVAKTDMKVATVPIGYADGYSRLLSNKGKMIVNGTLVNIIGNVCMDQVMLDVSKVNGVKQGDIVTILGSDGDYFITADDIAREIGTIGYEIVCVVGRRVPRIYIKNSKTVEVVDYILDSPIA